MAGDATKSPLCQWYEHLLLTINFAGSIVIFCPRLGRGLYALHGVQSVSCVTDQNPRTGVGTEETWGQGSVSLSYIRRDKYYKAGEYFNIEYF